MQFNQSPWWMTDEYTDTTPTGPIDLAREDLWGPHGAAMTTLWDDGTTGKGWGRDKFMGLYTSKRFEPRRVLSGYTRGKWNYTWIMRSARMVCIDIDGKNNGFAYASELGYLPPTVAETSKSGNGYHLFYLVDDTWDENDGFAGFSDHIGIVTGVDIRGTGCVYHYPTQRWNNRELAPLPQHLVEKLRARAVARQLATDNIKKTLELEEEDIIMMHNDLMEELKKPIPQGKRNNTLFAIGSKMRAAEVPDWETLLADRASAVGLDDHETDKLIRNIKTYQG